MIHLSPYSLGRLLEYGVEICVCTPNAPPITLCSLTSEAQSPHQKPASTLVAPHQFIPSLHRTHSQA